MRGIIVTSLVTSLALAAAYVYDKMARPGVGFSATSLLGVSGLVAWALFCLMSLIYYRTHRRVTVARVWVVVISVFFTYSTLDVVTGLVLIHPLSPLMVSDEYTHHRLAPNTVSEYRSRSFWHLQRVNNVGLRGPDIEPTKGSSTYRILMLGDSFTMGKGVGDGETFSVLLEELLSADRPAGAAVEFQVLNAGVDSYASILSFLQLTRMAELLDPDLVVLNFDMSDLIQEAAYRAVARRAPDGRIVAVPGILNGRESGAMDIRGWIDQHLYMTRLAVYYVEKALTNVTDVEETTIGNTVTRAGREVVKHTLADDDIDRGQQWEDVFESILNARRFCADRGIRFLLTIYPWGHQVSESEWVPGRRAFVPDGAVISDRSVVRIEEFAAANDVDLLNMFSAFRADTGRVPLYFSHDMHWTPAGHALVAREYDRFLRDTVFTGSSVRTAAERAP